MYFPWILAGLSEAIIIASRIIVNRLISIRRIPNWLSVMNTAGFIGLVGAACWAVVAMGWWGLVGVLLLYTVSNFVPSAFVRVRRDPEFAMKVAIERAARELAHIPLESGQVDMIERRAIEIVRDGQW